MIRIGIGYDVHRLVEGPPLALGGIILPHTKGSLGHSDGDVLIHALCDAILGALNRNDIGYHFSDTDVAYKGIDSKILLCKVNEMMRAAHYRIGNIDCTLILQSPRVSSFIPQMKEKLAEVLAIATSQISIKATTTEKLGFEGREEGLSAQVVVLLFYEPI